jgi:hypothetical protein
MSFFLLSKRQQTSSAQKLGVANSMPIPLTFPGRGEKQGSLAQPGVNRVSLDNKRVKRICADCQNQLGRVLNPPLHLLRSLQQILDYLAAASAAS